MRCGGEILKFTGDGFLAIFPVLDPENRPCATCGSALDAAEQALALNRALNDRRRVAGLPGLDLDLVLHFGRVVYGNVGTSRRLDFTVIGRAVNEASRIEELRRSGPFDSVVRRLRRTLRRSAGTGRHVCPARA
jgi:adenylate cyclase